MSKYTSEPLTKMEVCNDGPGITYTESSVSDESVPEAIPDPLDLVSGVATIATANLTRAHTRGIGLRDYEDRPGDLSYEEYVEYLASPTIEHQYVQFVGGWTKDGYSHCLSPTSPQRLSSPKAMRTTSQSRPVSTPNSTAEDDTRNSSREDTPSSGRYGVTDILQVPMIINSIEISQSPSPEPGLTPDRMSICESVAEQENLDTFPDLEEIAIEVFGFWPAGVDIYANLVPTSDEISKSKEGNAIESSVLSANSNNLHPTKGARRPQRWGQADRSGKDVVLARGSKQNADARKTVVEWRCLYEAGQNNLTCDNCHLTRFDSMLRHLRKHEHPHYGGISLDEQIEQLKQIFKQSDEKAQVTFSASLFAVMYPGRYVPYLRFDRLPSGGRDPHDPPASMIFPQDSTLNDYRTFDPMPEDSGEEQTPTILTAGSSYVLESAVATHSHLEQSQAERRAAARSFETDMKKDPLFAIRIRSILSRVNSAERRAELRREEVAFQSNSKRKELASEEASEPAKRARQAELHSSELVELNYIDAELTGNYKDAEREMQELYDSRIITEPAPKPMRSYSQEPLPQIQNLLPAITLDNDDSEFLNFDQDFTENIQFSNDSRDQVDDSI